MNLSDIKSMTRIPPAAYRNRAGTWLSSCTPTEKNLSRVVALSQNELLCELAHGERSPGSATAAIDGTGIQLEHELVGMTQAEGAGGCMTPDGCWELHFSNGATATADIVVGADGHASAVRALLDSAGLLPPPAAAGGSGGGVSHQKPIGGAVDGNELIRRLATRPMSSMGAYRGRYTHFNCVVDRLDFDWLASLLRSVSALSGCVCLHHHSPLTSHHSPLTTLRRRCTCAAPPLHSRCTAAALPPRRAVLRCAALCCAAAALRLTAPCARLAAAAG